MRRLRYLLPGRLLPCALLLLAFLCAGAYLAIRIPQALAPMAIGERLFSLGTALFVAVRAPAERRVPRLLLLLLLPWSGAVICLFLRAPKPFERADAPPEGGMFGAIASLAGKDGAAGHARDVHFFRTGGEMRASLLRDLSEAKREILLIYYIVARGAFFDGVLSLLEQKARAGVRVRLFYDDFGCAATLPRNFARTLRKRGIEAAVFRPLKPLPLSELNRRDHRKLTLIDGEIAYLGGINLSDEYIGKLIRFGHWKDTAVRVTGAPVARLAGKEAPSGGSVPCVLFSDRAENRERAGEEIFLRLLASAEREVLITTPYLVPTERLLAALGSAARAGVSVRIMIPHIPDKKSVFVLTRSYARELEKAGVCVREYTAGFLHSKVFVADGEHAVVGSYNLDGRSLGLQAENAAYFGGGSPAREIAEDFAALWETGSPVKKAGGAEKIAAFLLRLVAPLL